MPLESPDSIDIITWDDNEGTTLVLTDAGVTTDPEERNALFAQKIRTYAQAIFSGILVEDNPEFSPEKCQIRVICSTQPTPEMLKFSAIRPRDAREEKPIPVEFELMTLRGGTQAVPIERPKLVAPPVSAELKKLIDMTFDFGLGLCKDGSEASHAFWIESDGVGDGVSVAAFMTEEDTPDAARKHAASLPVDVRLYAVVYNGEMGSRGSALSPAIIVEASERGQAHAVVFGQRYQPKRFLRKFASVGEREFLAEGSNYFTS
jgi:hypothetical protein